MKTLALASLLIFSSLVAQGRTLPSDSTLSVQTSTIDQTIRLFSKDRPGSSLEKVSVVVTDGGMSTDVSPRYKVYLTYQSYAEMGNITTSFLISDKAFRFLSATRSGPGTYVIKTVVYDDRGFVEVTQTINAAQMLRDEAKLRESCGRDFCDVDLKTSIEIKETWKEAKFESKK